MQYLLLVIALAVAVALSMAYVPMREGGSGAPEMMPEQLEDMAPGMSSRDGVSDDGATSSRSDARQRGKSGYYRWRDEDGSWHYGQRPPAGVDEYERIESGPVTTKSPEQIQSGAPPSGE
jgi:hypothetical protein